MTKIVNYDQSLEEYYRYIMDYLEAKYAHGSVEPVFLEEKKVAEMNYYETQVRQVFESGKPVDVLKILREGGAW